MQYLNNALLYGVPTKALNPGKIVNLSIVVVVRLNDILIESKNFSMIFKVDQPFA
jgi:hypothetical protein